MGGVGMPTERATIDFEALKSDMPEIAFWDEVAKASKDADNAIFDGTTGGKVPLDDIFAKLKVVEESKAYLESFEPMIKEEIELGMKEIKELDDFKESLNTMTVDEILEKMPKLK